MLWRMQDFFVCSDFSNDFYTHKLNRLVFAIIAIVI